MEVSGFRPLEEFLVACYHPVAAYQTAAGEVLFAERSGHDFVRTLSLPCGQCVGCRLERSRQWAVRCLHEVSLYERNCFVTLTYRDADLPPGGSLRYADFQKFMRELRRRHKDVRIRFFVAGEYGEQLSRPHYHACLFNFDFVDKKLWRSTSGGHKLYVSKELEELWPHGFHSIGELTFESAAYVARYCVKKVTGDPNVVAAHYGAKVPEFAVMSRRPGLGSGWLDRFWKDIHRDHQVVVNGRKVAAPRFYRKRLADLSPDNAERVQYEHELRGRERAADNSDARLEVREVVERARLALKGGRNGFSDSGGA